MTGNSAAAAGSGEHLVTVDISAAAGSGELLVSF